MPQETILIVDDSDSIRDLLKDHILEPMGYRVFTAVDGRMGLEMALHYNPDLILLDMNLPNMSGLELLANLRQTTCTSPVIFMTVYGSEKIAVQAFKLGVRDYLNKPFTIDEVQKAIDNALREKRLELEREELKRNLVAAEAVRDTIVTLNHYLNNYLMVVLAGLKLVEEGLQGANQDPMLLKIASDSYRSAQGIKAVMQVLRNTAHLKQVDYTNSTAMIDIQAALREALEKLRRSEE